MGKSTEEYNYFDIKISIKFTALDKSMKCTQVLFKIHETFTSFTPPEVCLYDCSHHLSWCNLNSFSDFFVMQCHVVMHKTEVNSWRVFEEAKNIIMLCYTFTQLRKAALHVVIGYIQMGCYLMKWRTLQNAQLSTLFKFIALFSASACCLKWGSYLSMLEAWLTFISGFQETHLKQSINSVPNRVAISVERSKI